MYSDHALIKRAYSFDEIDMFLVKTLASMLYCICFMQKLSSQPAL